MTEPAEHAPRRSRRRLTVWLLVGAGLALFGAANAHLVYVAFSSQPDCVAHMKPGQAGGSPSGFAAARSACASG
ncbi:hypothetical protein [Enterovirga rhinocerotis]|uniref:Uncharacterized protein n=1 Tax=Enterovirga rhinocerotis TaxID=1339210 RepID=A0A4R7C7W9_9HYPH|nr:hypothetical protein [Enterovirga rhinocerotis]TDR94072.1 hypothetical protein EV668_1344 [Enterovirga rhinocerotis]